MIVALLNQKGGTGKTTLSLHLAGALASQDRRVLVVDADPQGSALDWADARAQAGLLRRFGVVGLSRETLHREVPALARDADHVVIDGPPRVTGIARSALLAADLVLMPVQPSPFDGWASAEMLRLLEEARVFRPELAARFVLNRCAARTVIARETRAALQASEPPLLSARIGQRVAFAEAAASGQLVDEQDGADTGRRRDRRLRCGGAGVREMNARDSRRAPFAARPRDPDAWVRSPAAAETGPAKRDLYTARLTIDVTPELRGRIKVAAFRRGQTVADMLRSMLEEAFPESGGERP